MNCLSRSQNVIGGGAKAKSFFNTERAQILWNHFPTRCLNQRCKGLRIGINKAQVKLNLCELSSGLNATM